MLVFFPHLSIQFSSVTQPCLTLCEPMDCSTPGFPVITNSQSLLKLMSIEPVMPSSHLILCRPLLLLPPAPPSIRVFSNESTLCMRWPKYWSFSFSISPSNEHPGLISFRMNWLDILAVQGTLKSLLQHHSSKASILWRSAFFIAQLSHPYMTTGQTIALTRWTFVDNVMSLLFNMLSRLVIIFLPRSKRLLISWLQSPSAVILEPQKIKSDTVSPSICHEVMGPFTMILVFWMLSFKPTFSLSSFTFIKRQVLWASVGDRWVSSVQLPKRLYPGCGVDEDTETQLSFSWFIRQWFYTTRVKQQQKRAKDVIPFPPPLSTWLLNWKCQKKKKKLEVSLIKKLAIVTSSNSTAIT